MRKNPVKENIRNKKVSFGVWLCWFDPNLVEFYGRIGFDFVVIDGEHEAIERENTLEIIRACDVVGLVPVVRVPENNPSLIGSYLDMGAMGIMVPHVQTVDDARKMTSAMKFAPQGKRGDSIGRAADFGLNQSAADYYRQANEETMSIAVIEDIEGINNLDEIMTIEEIDVFGIGDGDLSHSFGIPGERRNPKLRKTVEETEEKIFKAGKQFDAVRASIEEIKDSITRGSLMVSIPDVFLLKESCRQFFTAFD